MTYKFKVEVYRHTPYGGILLAVAVLIGAPASFFLLQKIDSLHPDVQPARPPIQAIPPAAQAAPPVIHSAPKQALTKESSKLKAMMLTTDKKVQTLTCIFEGKATYQGVSSPHASVLVQVFTMSGKQTKGTITNADGSYRLEVPVKAAANDNLDWSIVAYTPEFQKVELVGRRIVTEDTTVSIEQTLAFLPH